MACSSASVPGFGSEEGQERDVVAGPRAAQVDAERTGHRPLTTELHRVGGVGEEHEPVALAQRRLGASEPVRENSLVCRREAILLASMSG